MKTALTALSIAAAFCASAQFSKEEIKKLKKAAKESGAHGSYEVHSQRFHVTSDPVRLKDSYFFLYFELEKQGDSIVKSPMSMKIQYNAGSWLFMDEISIAMGFVKEGDENITTTANIRLPKGARVVNSDATITEITTAELNPEMYELLKYLSTNSRFTSVKLSGEDKYAEFGVFGNVISNNLPGIFTAYENVDFTGAMQN